MNTVPRDNTTNAFLFSTLRPSRSTYAATTGLPSLPLSGPARTAMMDGGGGGGGEGGGG
eukprot:CAMPEP_0197594200 /NCGR_PEP_ID=MMETSP1326-20131121/20038_1 /TAXON_ID=1155430 /ORGANISM="Genus nov. species nov., Strain RCC2288" /LENGTH=58 /DNA_ID=CAMNT_0043160335 /DNA_START=46 /DNA_END=219 /DNA_ORIENTATION=-